MHPIILEATLVKALLVILIVYAVYSLFIRIIIPSMMRKYVSDIQNQFSGGNPQPNQNKPNKKEGEVSITYLNKDKTAANNAHDSEYVDYEEIK